MVFPCARILLLAFAAFCASAQTFETASIKPADPKATDGGLHSTPGQLTMNNWSLKDWIEQAFDVKDFSLSGPPWLDEAHFNVVARSNGPVEWKQTRVMLQNLLVERFKLAYHRESKVLPAYVLVVDKKGLKLPVSPEGESNFSSNSGRMVRITGTHITLAALAEMLAEQLHSPVTDMTGLDGHYDVKLQYTPFDSATEEGRKDPTAVSVFAALQDQAGLKLETKKTPVEVLVIDHIERQATEN